MEEIPTLRSTPHLDRSETPTAGELQRFEKGIDRFPDIGSSGGFRSWDYHRLFPETDPTHAAYNGQGFNCFAWSLGLTDRWINAGSVAEMERLYESYYFEQCNPEAAEAEVYRILDAPAELPPVTGMRQIPRQSPRALVRHAHRRDNSSLDTQPGLGCSSKIGADSLIAHNRSALVDDRGHAARGPSVQYGSIYQHWRRSEEHPSKPGKEGNKLPRSDLLSRADTSNSSGTSIGSTESPAGSHAIPSTSSTFVAPYLPQETLSPHLSGKRYRRLPQMDNPYGSIPPAGSEAGYSAERILISIMMAFPGASETFDSRWQAWRDTWSESASSTPDGLKGSEFEELLALGPKIIPLVVYKLARYPNDFFGVYLYNELEKDKDYLVDPDDVLNYLVLQRQANLIVEMNYERNRLVRGHIDDWKERCMRNGIHSSVEAYILCDEFDKLVDMGGSIISHVMLTYAGEYAREPTGFWYELLHQIVHGWGEGAGTGPLVNFSFREQYKTWSEWFEYGEHDQAPRWRKGNRVV